MSARVLAGEIPVDELHHGQTADDQKVCSWVVWSGQLVRGATVTALLTASTQAPGVAPVNR